MANSPLGFTGKAAFFYKSITGAHGSVWYTHHRALSLSFPVPTDTCFKSSSFIWFKVFLLLPKLLSLKSESVAGFVLLKGQEQSSVRPSTIKNFYLSLSPQEMRTNLLNIFSFFPP